MYLYPASPPYTTPTTKPSKQSLSSLCVRVFEVETMKQTLHSSALLMLILLLVSSSKLSARFIATKQGQEEVKFNEITSVESLVEKDSSELMNLIGLESCDNGDEECFKRRILSEAHLDYIYTQHHKP